MADFYVPEPAPPAQGPSPVADPELAAPEPEGPPPPPDYMIDTLDESVWTSIWKDLKRVVLRTAQVLWVFSKVSKDDSVYQETDLFGPIIYGLLLSIFSYFVANKGSKDAVFLIVFIVVFLGTALVGLNLKLVGGAVSILGVVSLMGYSTAPLVLSSLVIWIVKDLAHAGTAAVVITLIVCTALALAWSIYAVCTFFKSTSPPGRKFLVLYPMGLYYACLALITIYSIPTGGSDPAPPPAPPEPEPEPTP